MWSVHRCAGSRGTWWLPRPLTAGGAAPYSLAQPLPRATLPFVVAAQHTGFRPLKRAEYGRLVDAGCFEDERVELLSGGIVKMSPHGAPHDGTLQILEALLKRVLGTRADVRVQSAFAASDDSQPEPDIAVVPRADYRSAHPERAFLIVEIAHSSLQRDREKALIYAKSGVPEYWIVNLVDKLVERFRTPTPTGYQAVDVLDSAAVLALEKFSDCLVAASEIL